MTREIPLMHPGVILLEDFLKPMGITQYRLAKELGVPQRRIGQICTGQRSITPDTALRLDLFYFAFSYSFLSALDARRNEIALTSNRSTSFNIYQRQHISLGPRTSNRSTSFNIYQRQHISLGPRISPGKFGKQF